MEPIKDIRLEKGTSVEDLVDQFYEGGGFTAKNIAVAREIYKKMLGDKECFKFFSFPACVVATGLRGVIKDMVRKKMVDAVITTCGTLDHDLARIWKDYCQGTFEASDEELHKKNIHRLGNIFVPVESYGLILEEKLQKLFPDIYKKQKDISTHELIWAIGDAIAGEKNAESSIIYWCAKNRIPMFVPGITDGAFGYQSWMFWQDHKDFNINLMKDEQKLSDIVYDSKKTGALILGGGISKHHVIWWNQFKDGLDYAVYISTAVEYDGSLSGARTREAISWGKIKENAKHITLDGDATVLLPLVVAGL
jgi:deoxyhypusine synthase